MTQVTLKPSTSEATISDYLNKQSQKTLLKFLTCGSVDDGKSTLIGRLLFETGSVPDSELKTLEADSQKFGTTGGQYDFALLVDGLSSEREQGITIDVAYRYFATSKRKFIVADTPGHEQYTRNMATGASNCDMAVIMLDASKGLLTQTRRHSFIASLLGIKHVVVAVNKMDLINFSEEKYLALCDDYHNFAQTLGFESLSLIPISAMNGDNVTSLSPNMPWYKGLMLLEYLEKVEPQQRAPEPFAMSVQMVSRPDRTFRGYAGRINSGSVAPGDSIRIAPSGKVSTVKEIVTFDGKKKLAVVGESVTLTLTDEVDISRGNVLTAQQTPCEVANQFQTTLLWMSEKSLVVSRQYILQLANQSVIATPVKLKHRIDISTLQNSSADKLLQNEFGVCELSVNKPLSFKTYQQCKSLGGFILIDRLSNETVACGFIDFALRRSGNIYHHAETITSVERSAIKSHAAKVIWLTGLSGAGKSTIANILEQKLNQKGVHTMLLDGDNVRHGLNKNLGFTKTDRAENIRRIAEVAKLMTQAGLVTIVSFISPFKAERQMARELIGEECFTEVFVDVSLTEAKKRDPKGLYKKALSGEIKNFTGLDSPYEKPTSSDLIIDTESVSAETAADKIMEKISL